MNCFICDVDCSNLNYPNDIRTAAAPSAISIAEGTTQKTLFTYSNLLEGLISNLKEFINVQISDNDIICKTCQNLIECYDLYYYEAKICQELLMRQFYRKFEIPANLRQWSTLNLDEYDVDAADLYMKNCRINQYECQKCEYKTKYTDTFAPHFKLHKCSFDKILKNIGIQSTTTATLSIPSTIKPAEDTVQFPHVLYNANVDNIEVNNFDECIIVDYDDNMIEEYTNDVRTDEQNYTSVNIIQSMDQVESINRNDFEVKSVKPVLNRKKLNEKTKNSYIIVDDLDFLNDTFSDDIYNKIILKNKLKCNMCEEKFQTKLQFDIHLKSHNRYKCSFCEYISAKEKLTENHILDKHPSELEFCNRCNKKTIYSPCQHNDKNTLCKICKLLIPNELVVKHNIIRHLNCIQCNLKLSSLRPARSHYNGVHLGLPQIRCRNVGCTFRCFTAKEKDLHKCEFFPKKCKLCPYIYKTSQQLREHFTTHSNKPLYVCYECGQTFRHLATYNLHMKYHSNPKPYKCNICGLSLTSQSGLKNHIRRHNGECKYKCAFCSKKFVTLTLKKIHESVHTGNYRISCKYHECERGFNKREEYIKHLRNVHNDYQLDKMPCKYKVVVRTNSLASKIK